MTEVVGLRWPPPTVPFPVTYGPSMAQMVALINNSASCCQYLRYDCHHSILGYTGIDRYWSDRYGNEKNYFPGGPPGGCPCGNDRSCSDSKLNGA